MPADRGGVRGAAPASKPSGEPRWVPAGEEFGDTTGLPAFAESPKLSAKTSSRSATYLPRAALGKEPSAKHLPAKDSLPRAPLGKIFTESNVKALG